ncbi:hypothetical protein NXH76_24015 [Blautia schinkii]|nr:hypothetical protein [Blautia schinkii]
MSGIEMRGQDLKSDIPDVMIPGMHGGQKKHTEKGILIYVSD